MIDPRSVILAVSAIIFLFLSFMAGQDIGRRNMVADIKNYGCEKVIGVYDGTIKK